RPLDPIWEHFATTPLKSSGHFSAIYKYCNTQFSCGHPNKLEVHLAKKCEDESLDDEIRSKYLEIAIQRQLSKEKTSSKNQLKKQKITFAMCGLLFSIIENLWFINILKSLRSLYVLFTRKYLSNTLLNEEVIKINWETKKYLKTTDNLTL
ncbi:23648_t:CDS:2, partial [Cetraspora pellucida]